MEDYSLIDKLMDTRCWMLKKCFEKDANWIESEIKNSELPDDEKKDMLDFIEYLNEKSR